MTKMTQGQRMAERIEEYNQSQLEERKSLPNLIKMIELAQTGNMEVFDSYFYGYKLIERAFYDGKNQAYEVNKVRFWDEPLSIFLTNLKKKYCKQIAIGEQSSFGERRITYKTNVSNFEESEIDTLWYEWMREFVVKVNLDNFEKETEAQKLNALRLYIRKSFENNLKKIDNSRIKLERVRVDGKLYYVKNQQEEVFFDDIYLGRDDEGEQMQFLDIVGADDDYSVVGEEEKEFTSKDFIENNLKDVLTKKQYEKYQMLLDYINEYGAESILDKHSGKIIKARIQRIMYPDKEYKNIERVDSLVKIMNQRMEKALDKNELKYTSLEEEKEKELSLSNKESSEVTTYTGGFTEEEVQVYFDKFLENIFKAYTEKKLSFVKGESGMLPSLDSMLTLPFNVHEEFIKGGKTVKMAIIKEYHNPEKFKLKAGKKEVMKKQQVSKPENRNDRYITPDKLKEIRRQSGK